ncbi:SDR family oxidoreductase [Nonomuraea recticatena]|uniref:SDR family oxidoreductase n=2 Tax=Nonomuraea recticatena TaxID=46178 RepID=UPI0031FA0E59
MDRRRTAGRRPAGQQRQDVRARWRPIETGPPPSGPLTPCHNRAGHLVSEGMTNSEQTSVLITGANKGLGLEAARRLGEQGWTIFLGSRDEGRGRAAADKLTADGANVVMVPLDVTSDESVADAVRLVREHTDRLDVLINNAGTSGRAIAPADATAEEIHSVYDTNVYGPIRVTHAFLPLLRAAEHPRVVMVSSAVGSFAVVTDPQQPSAKMHELAYSSSKAALNMITLRYAHAIPEIKFNIATPGEVANRKFAATDMNHHTGELTVTEGTDSIVRLATIDADGPSGIFIDRLGPIAW